MTLQELMKMLVEEDSKDARFALVEENQDLMNGSEGPGEEVLAQIDDLTTKLEAAVADLEAQKQKYRDTFFNPSKAEEPEEEPEEEKQPSLEDLGM